MEVGAVKQAYNNEVILLKKKLNQAKIQTIHKLTRKAKTLTEKKVPEKLKLKFTKKAESAVKEVLILKKIKARDVARFIVTHKGQLNEYLNRPEVDQDKACARLLLHKALQDKYKVIREGFSNISIKDLLMSRQERRKLKKEAREKQKNKKKGKDANGPVQAEGEWDVEDVNVDTSKLSELTESDIDDNESESSTQEKDSNDEESDDESENGDDSTNDVMSSKVIVQNNVSKTVSQTSDAESSDLNEANESDGESDQANLAKSDNDCSESDDNAEDKSVGMFVKRASSLPTDKIVDRKCAVGKKVSKNEDVTKKPIEKKQKEGNKNKNLKNKILLKNFNKEKSEVLVNENKIVDPFFITATGENYMSVAEPRPPDEVKEVHKQGNRKYRRAVMFGNVPKAKPRRDDFRQDNNSRFNKFHDNKSDNFTNNFKSNNGFDNHGHQTKFDKSVDRSNKGNFKDRRNDGKNNGEELKPEKLHPSWEAKKRQSGILPFQGKKIVFDEG